MFDEAKWAKPYSPPVGGIHGVWRKIEDADARARTETRILGGLALSLALALVALAFWPAPSVDLSPALHYADSGLAVENAQAVRVADTPPGIRIYWVLR